MQALRPAFQKKGGVVTAGSSSTISDGAAALVLCSRKKARELGLTPLAVIRGLGDAAQPSEQFTTTPALACGRGVLRSAAMNADCASAWRDSFVSQATPRHAAEHMYAQGPQIRNARAVQAWPQRRGAMPAGWRAAERALCFFTAAAAVL